MHLLDAEIETIIEHYKEQECLWKKSHQDYKNKYKKESAYDAIAAATTFQKEVIKEKVHSLRTIYFQNVSKAKKAKSGSAGGKQVKWKFFPMLSFLGSEAADCGGTDTLLLPKSADADQGDKINEILDITSEESSEPKEKKKKTDDRSKCWTMLIDAIKKDDEKDDFLEFVASALRQLTKEEVKNNVKCAIKRILAQGLLEDGADEAAKLSFEECEINESVFFENN